MTTHETSGSQPTAIQAAARGQGHQASTHLIHALLRLVKTCQLYPDENDAVSQAQDACKQALAHACERLGQETAFVRYAGSAVLVNGTLLRASRDAYAVAHELGAMLAACDVAEIGLGRNVAARDLGALGRLVAQGQRDKRVAGRLAAAPFHDISVRSSVPAAAVGTSEGSEAARAEATYAAAVFAVRAVHASRGRARSARLRRLKRVAMQLIVETAQSRAAMLALASRRTTRADSTAVRAAIIAGAMQERIDGDRALLIEVVMAALLQDLGKIRLLAAQLRGTNGVDADRLAGSAVVALSALGPPRRQGVVRTVLVHEALSTGAPPEDGLPAARVVALARRFAESSADERNSRETSDPIERALLGLLDATVGPSASAPALARTRDHLPSVPDAERDSLLAAFLVE